MQISRARATSGQSCMSGRAFWVGPGSSFSLSKCFGPISGLHTKLFHNIPSNDFFSWHRFVVLTAVTSVSEVIFLQLILFAYTVAFFYSLLSGDETSTRWRCFEIINLLRDSSLVLINDGLQTGFSCHSAILGSSFYACSAIVDSFVVVYFFLEKHYIPQYYPSLTS